MFSSRQDASLGADLCDKIFKDVARGYDMQGKRCVQAEMSVHIA